MNERDNAPLRRLRLLLRDHRVLDADARVPEGQFVASYLGSRSRYVNLTDIDWLGTGERVPHIALKVDKVLWASSRDAGLELASPVVEAVTRRVEAELEGGYLLSAGLLLAEGQGLNEYLQTAPRFVPLRDAELKPRGRALGDIAVNQESIQVVREVPETSEHARREA